MLVVGLSGEQDEQTTQGAIGRHVAAHRRVVFDSAAVAVLDGAVIAAAEEERFTGEKQTGAFPARALQYCLSEVGARIDDVDFVVHASRKVDIDADLSRAEHRPRRGRVNVRLANATHAYLSSGFREALVLVTDETPGYDGMSIFEAAGGLLRQRVEYGERGSLGALYAAVTRHLGFRPYVDHYKVMGLAPYGNPARFADLLLRCVEHGDQGAVVVAARTPVEFEEAFVRWCGHAALAPRGGDEPLTEAHADLAAALQQATDAALLHVLRHWQRETSARSLCMAGSLALNCTSNGVVLRSRLFEQVFVPPAAGDDGAAIGAALYAYHRLRPEAARVPLPLPLLGPAIDTREIERATAGLPADVEVTYCGSEEVVRRAAELLAEGRIVAQVHGRMEFGPRALGNRSILADPRRAELRERVNALVKRREPFRPFAPAVKAERAHLYFETEEGERFPHMSFTMPVRAAQRASLAAVTHVDGSARLQTVDAAEHPRFWSLLDAFERRVGLPVLLNTSFNVMSQPIVRTAEEAVSTLLSTDVCAMVLGDHLLLKRGRRPS